MLLAWMKSSGFANSAQVLPGGKAVLVAQSDGERFDCPIEVHSLETGESKVVIESGRDARYVPTGHLVYVADGAISWPPPLMWTS